jgi:RHH-type proline utilization regulon transcriptional repressor/proline dehydrogenase/delta 1-pyrroline-5-carboxylate dehydrogenase
MALVADDPALRAALLRFVDVAPACRSAGDLAAHLAAYLEELDERPGALRAASRMAGSAPGRGALGAVAVRAVRHTARRFIVGESPRAARPVLARLWRAGVTSSVDLLGEATVAASEADRYAERCALALDELAASLSRLPARPALERDGLGPVPRANLSVKVSALTPLLRPEAPELGQRDAAPRLRALLARAHRLGAHVHVDTESLDSRDAVLGLVLDLLAEDGLADGPSAGVVLQAYLRDAADVGERLLAWAARTRRAAPLTVRLVKGAYWDHEVVAARRAGWPVPVFETRAECDRSFEALTVRLVAARAAGLPLRPAVASHNLRSVAHAIAVARAAGLPDGELELQVLRGLGDDLQHALARTGHRVRAYCPVGDLVAGMGYLVRRLLENTANDSFLHDRASGRPLEELLAAP